MFAAHAVLKPRLKNKVRHGLQVLSSRRTTITSSSAWGEYQRSQWIAGVRPTSAEGKLLRKKLYEDFQNITPEERGRLQGVAAAHTAHAANVGNDLAEPLTGANDPGGPSRRKSARKRAFVRAVAAFTTDRVWSSGAGIMGPWHCVRQEFIDTSPTSEVEQHLDDVFKYDSVVVPNPPGPHPPEAVCASRFGGLCEKDDECDQCQVCIANIWVELKNRRLSDKKVLPFFLLSW